MSVVATWWWYYENIAPHDRPFPHVNWGWGFVHGLFVLPNLIYELFDHKATFAQFPNTGAEYDWGWGFGLALFIILSWKLLDAFARS